MIEIKIGTLVFMAVVFYALGIFTVFLCASMILKSLDFVVKGEEQHEQQ